jgi:rhodanese-related sulfurtransferase
MKITLRLATILIASAALGAGYIELFKPELDWVPPAVQIDVENTVRDHHGTGIERHDEIVAKAGIDTATLLQLIGQGAFFIDGRTLEEFAEGHLDVPAITCITPDEMIDQAPLLADLLVSMPPVPIVLYCRSSECDDSKTSYVTLEEMFRDFPGFEQVYVYVEGWKGIQAAGLATRTGEALPTDQIIADFDDPAADADEPRSEPVARA